MSPDEALKGIRLIEEASRAGVTQVVHTSMAGTDRLTEMPGSGEGCRDEDVVIAKAEVEDAVRAAGFPRVTFLRPGWFMDNFIGPLVRGFFPDLHRGLLAVAWHEDQPRQRVRHRCVRGSRLADPARFDGEVIELASEVLTVAEIATALTDVLSRPIRYQQLSSEEVVATGQWPIWVRAREAHNDATRTGRGPYAPVDVSALDRFCIPLTRFVDWVAGARKQFTFDS